MTTNTDKQTDYSSNLAKFIEKEKKKSSEWC